jgi:hypothetical protein
MALHLYKGLIETIILKMRRNPQPYDHVVVFAVKMGLVKAILMNLLGKAPPT